MIIVSVSFQNRTEQNTTLFTSQAYKYAVRGTIYVKLYNISMHMCFAVNGVPSKYRYERQKQIDRKLQQQKTNRKTMVSGIMQGTK